MPLDGDLIIHNRVVRLAPLKHERTRMCRLASDHMNAMVRNSMRGDDGAAFLHQHAAEQLLTAAERISREIDAMEAGV